MKAKFTFTFATFTAELEGIDDLSDSDAQNKLLEVIDFLRDLDATFRDSDSRKAAAPPPPTPPPPQRAGGLFPQRQPVRYLPVEEVEDALDKPLGQWVEVQAFRVENYNGKRKIRVMGGNYAKFGVPLYLDSCRMTANLKRYLESLQLGVTPVPENMTIHAYVEVDGDGKPTRVTELGEV